MNDMHVLAWKKFQIWPWALPNDIEQQDNDKMAYGIHHDCIQQVKTEMTAAPMWENAMKSMHVMCTGDLQRPWPLGYVSYI